MKRYQLSGKEVKQLAQKYSFLDKKTRVEVVEDEERLFFADKKLIFIEKEGLTIPSLHVDTELKQIVVDMGAVPFVCKGADVMAPGITQMPDFEEDELLVVVDENNKKKLAIVKAMKSSAEIKADKTGKVLQNLHYVGDKYWNYRL